MFRKEVYGRDIQDEEVRSFAERKIMTFDEKVTDADGFPILYGGFVEQIADHRLEPYQMQDIPIADVTRFIVYNVEKITRDPAIAKYGITLVADLTGLRSFSQFNFGMAKSIFGVLQSSLPIRLHKIVVFNPPAFFGMVWAVLKHFLSAELHEKICMVRQKDSKLIQTLFKPAMMPGHLGHHVILLDKQ